MCYFLRIADYKVQHLRNVRNLTNNLNSQSCGFEICETNLRTARLWYLQCRSMNTSALYCMCMCTRTEAVQAILMYKRAHCPDQYLGARVYLQYRECGQVGV
jgi:hypothetical protein